MWGGTSCLPVGLGPTRSVSSTGQSSFVDLRAFPSVAPYKRGRLSASVTFALLRWELQVREGMSPYRKGCTCGMPQVGAAAEEDERSAEEPQPVEINRRFV